MLKLSFILPCYNVERYIADCLDSIYAQDLPEDEFEVICVNDCSTDGTGNVITEYASRHPNLIMIDHERNLTAGGARNTGMDLARGEYIWFVDPDDVIKPSSLTELLDMVKKENLDILMFNFEDVDEQLNYMEDELFLPESAVMTGQDYVTKFFSGEMRLLGIVWRCLFRAQFIRDNDLRYPTIRKAQDVVFIWKAILKAGRLQSITKVYYSFRINPNSVTHAPKNANVLFSERVLFGDEVTGILKDKSYFLQPQIASELGKTCSWCANTNLEIINHLNDEEKDSYYGLMRKNRDSLRRVRRYANWRNRMALRVGLGKREWKWRLKMINTITKGLWKK